MSEQDRYIPGVPCWTDTSQPDPEAAAEFYGSLFGWDLENVMPADAPQPYFIARIDGGDVGAISALPDGVPAQSSWSTYVWVDSADETAASVKAAGGAVLTEPLDVMDAGRMAVCSDREGATFSLWQAGTNRGATVVNQHGAVNFNNLNTRDPDSARAFYGKVFGWEALPMGDDFAWWALPDYGKFLDTLNPGTIARMEEMGAPAGFVDVVGNLVVLDGDRIEAPHWSTVFGAEDADATAAKAKELGGTVVTEPFDAPWVRSTVITDPQGVTFTANQFVYENKELTA